MDSSSLEREDYGYFCILWAEAALNLGDYSEALIDNAVEIFRHSSNTSLFARSKFLKGWSMSLRGDHTGAKQELLEAYVNYLRCEDELGAARSMNRMAYGAMQTGSFDGATGNLEQALGIYKQLKDHLSQTKIAHNMAYVYCLAGKLQASMSVYKSYPADKIESVDKAMLNYYCMSSLPRVLVGNVKIARQTIAKCKPYLNEYIREKAIYYENLGLINILDNDYLAAEKALTQGLEISLEIAPESALVSQIKRLFGDLYIATEKFDLAEKYASEALEVAVKINERLEIAACWRVFAQVEGNRENDDKAREWYHKAIDLFNQISARYELAATRYLAATSGMYHNGERTAMLYMAREYFVSEEVTHYVEKVDVALKAFPIRPVPAVDTNGSGCPTVIAVSSAMKKLVDFAGHVAQSEMNILLTGPTGSGKDLMANYIHHASGRKGELVTVNAAAIPNEMIESELFGHTKGAFTGANKDRPGLFEQADHGTFYLNEIADATPEFQAKLLEVLETRKVRRLGENKSRPAAFRLVAATNHDLQQRMRDNLFRVDLYHRLNEIPISLPPLSERSTDIPALLKHFIVESGAEVNGDGDLLDRLGQTLSLCAWPGNVRQLRAEVNRLWMASRGDLSRMIDMAAEYEADSESEPLLEVLQQAGGNRSEAARVLGISEGTVRYRLKKLDLN